MLCRSLARVNIPHSMINWFWFYHKDQTASIHYLLSLIFFRLFCLMFGTFFVACASGFYLQPFRLVSYSFMNFWLRKIKVNHVAELFDNGKKVQRKIFCIFVSSGFQCNLKWNKNFQTFCYQKLWNINHLWVFNANFFFVHDLVKNLWTSNRCFLCMQSTSIDDFCCLYKLCIDSIKCHMLFVISMRSPRICYHHICNDGYRLMCVNLDCR